MSYQPIPDKTQVRADLIGTVVLRYELVEKIGDGRNGAVYRARHTETGQEAAIKVTRDAIAERDVRAATSLEHPGIARVFGFGRLPDGRHWIAMELMQGEGLDWALHRSGTLLVPEAIRVLHQVADALDAAHARSLVHGNLKLSSVFLTRPAESSLRAKLLDFGISPPEGSPLPSVDGDLFALGMLGYAMLTGKTEVARPLPRPIAPVLPVVLEELVADLVEAASKLRPRTAADVRAKLEPLLPLPAPPPVAVAPEPVEPQKDELPPAALPRRLVVPIWLAAAVPAVVLLLAAVVFFAWPSAPQAPIIVAPPTPPAEPAPPPAMVLPDEPVVEKREPKEPRGSKAPKAPKAGPAPSEGQLSERIDRLDAKLRKKPGPHDEAVHNLSKQRVRLTGSTPEERKDVAHQLDLWEQVYLKK